MEIISNVNAKRSAVRSIAWLGLSCCVTAIVFLGSTAPVADIGKPYDHADKNKYKQMHPTWDLGSVEIRVRYRVAGIREPRPDKASDRDNN